MLVQSKTNEYKVTDLVEAVAVKPQEQNLVEAIGVFTEDERQTRTLRIERDVVNNVVVPRINYDGKRVNITPDYRISTTIEIPRVGIEDSIEAADLQDYMSFGGNPSEIKLEALGKLRAKKMAKIDKALRDTLEVDRITTLMTGSPYDPTGVLRRSYGTFNIYNELGITRKEVELDLSDNPTESVNELFLTVRDAAYNYGGGRIVVLAGRKLFAAVSSNPYILDIKTQLGNLGTMSQLLGREQAAGLDYRFRSVEFGDILFIDAGSAMKQEADGSLVPVVGEDEGVAFPLGGDMYTTYFAPEQRFDTVNTTAVKRTLREMMYDDQTLLHMFGESNFFNMLEVPEAVVSVKMKATP